VFIYSPKLKLKMLQANKKKRGFVIKQSPAFLIN
jgi:hypothetical protein